MRLKVMSLAVFAVLAAGQASADGIAARLNKKLHGQYSAQQTETCTSAPAGFGPAPGFAALGPTNASTASTHSLTTYNGDGTFSLEGEGLQIATKFADPSVTVTNPVQRTHFVCQGTYQVNPDDTFSADYTCTGNVLTGVVPGLAFNLIGGHFDGLIVNKKTLHATQKDVRLETVSTVYGAIPRVCARTGTSVKLARDSDNEIDD